MSASSSSGLSSAASPTRIDYGAVETLKYIRSTIEASQTFTAISGKGCVAMGLTALAAAALDAVPVVGAHWLGVWIAAAGLASALALALMAQKAHAQGSSLRRAVAKRFFMALVPAFCAGAVLTAALVGTADREVIAGVWLLLYGVGLAACGVFSIPVVVGSGIAFMALGTATMFAPAGFAPAALAVGFGGIHIVLGAIIIRRHGG
jgi:hypothetical protein